MTKAQLLALLAPYPDSEEVVFVTFSDNLDIIVHEQAEVAKDHCTTRTNPDGSKSMPVAIYLTDDGVEGRPGVLGGTPKLDPDIFNQGGQQP